jgi:hypothetical protein
MPDLRAVEDAFVRRFLASAAAILAVTGTLKLVAALGGTAILGVNDPILHIPNRLLLACAGGVEVAAVVSIWLASTPIFPCAAISALGAEFLLYRATFVLGRFSRGCPCLGALTDSVHLRGWPVNEILWGCATWLFLGGAVGAFRLWRGGGSGLARPPGPAARSANPA